MPRFQKEKPDDFPLTPLQQSLVTAHMPFFWSLIGKHIRQFHWSDPNPEEVRDEIASVAFLYLIRAAQKYEYPRGKFTTYSSYWIKQGIVEAKIEMRKHGFHAHRRQFVRPLSLHDENGMEWIGREQRVDTSADSPPKFSLMVSGFFVPRSAALV